MGHCISVYLMNKSELRNEKIDSVIENKSISKDEIVWTELKCGIIATTYIPNLKEFKKGKSIADIHTDYFGGGGHQSARLFINGEKVYDVDDEFTWSESPINTVLKMIGVDKEDHKDEFDTVGLGNYRSNDQFES